LLRTEALFSNGRHARRDAFSYKTAQLPLKTGSGDPIYHCQAWIQFFYVLI